jgi:isocitrate dehydrogenase (NAD+)
MMLDHLKKGVEAQRLRRAIADTLNIDQVRTGDLGGKATTAIFTAALVARIRGA